MSFVYTNYGGSDTYARAHKKVNISSDIDTKIESRHEEAKVRFCSRSVRYWYLQAIKVHFVLLLCLDRQTLFRRTK